MPRRPPGVRARGLGAELKELRAATGLSVRAVAERLGWTHSVVNRIELGKRKTTSEEVSALLVVYDVKGPERDRLLDLAREVEQPGWWETGQGGLPKQLPALIGFEATATRIVDAATVLVPGLLQTADYTREVMLSGLVSASEAEPLVAMRLGRQAVLSKREPPTYLAIIDEAVLRRPVGGPEVMADQLRAIAKASSRTNVTVQVLPFDLGGHPGLDGAYLIMEFAKAPTIVHLEHKRSSLFVDEPEDVRPFIDATARLRQVALGADETRRFLASLTAEYEQQE
jgi:transcriptional regulator with XRE-family HTH domain